MDKLIADTASALGLSPSLVVGLYKTAPHRYKVYPIRKRKDGEFRIIAQPSRAVKTVQRFLVSTIMSELPIHDAATAYRKGASIKVNTEIHRENRFMLKMDFSNFFPSIRATDVSRHLTRYLGRDWSGEEIRSMARMVLWKPRDEDELRLSIGAPSSPLISNSIMYDFDSSISRHCKKLGISYSRYADDLCFSTSNANLLNDLEAFVLSAVRNLAYPDLRVNERKTVHTSKRHLRFITGLVVTNDGQVSLGRDRKRLIRSMIFRASQGELDNLQLVRLRGLLSFANDVEPDFVDRMNNKYGVALIQSIKVAVKQG